MRSGGARTAARRAAATVRPRGHGADPRLRCGPAATLRDTDRLVDPAERFDLLERSQEVREAVVSLPRVQRLALTLHYFEDLSYEDIASVMGLPLNTVKSHIRRGKQRLAAILTPSGLGEVPCAASN